MREREFKKLCEAIRLHTTDTTDDWEPAMDILMSLRNQHIKERRKTVKASTPVQQRKGKICAFYKRNHDCVFFPGDVSCGAYVCKVLRRRKLSPVA